MNSLLSRFHPSRTGAEADLGFAVTGDLPRPLDAKAFSKLYKAMDKVVKSLQNPRLSLSRSPPCLIDILPDIYMKLKEINNLGDTDCIEQQDFYFTTVNNIYDKCRRVNQLFKEHKEDILQESADSRKQLINLTIVIAYIFADLKALFNDSAHFDPNFRIAKEEAERWWKTTFPGRVIVSWVTFKEQIVTTFPTLNKIELSRLKSTIDLTCNDHVSVFEFDVFTRLFAPWAMLIKNFRKLTFHPGYMASATFENVKTILSKHRDKPGSYVFRMSCTKLGFWSIGYVTDHFEQRRDRISQIVVRDGKPIVEALMEGAQKGYYLYPNGEPSNPDLSELMHVRPKPQFQVTEAQSEEYSMIGSTFQECKICNIRDKDIQLDLCGHFMCSKCLNQWLSKGTGCPFCRCEIRSTQAVVIQPFQPAARKEPDKPVLAKPDSAAATDDDVLGSLPPPSHPPPALPPGYLQHEEPGAPIAESGNVASAETAERTSIDEHASGRRPRLPSPEATEPTADYRQPDSDSSSSDGQAPGQTAYVNLDFRALPQPPSSLPTHRSSASPSTSSLTSPTSPAVTSPSNPIAVPNSLPVVLSTSPALTSPTVSSDGPGGASGGRLEPLPGAPAAPCAKPRSKHTDAKDGDTRALKTLPPPPPVPLVPTTPPGAAAPPLPPNRPRASSLTPVGQASGGFRQVEAGRQLLEAEIRSRLSPPVPQARGFGRSGDLPQPPAGDPEDEYHVPRALEVEYNTPLAQEDEYNTPLAQEDLYNTPMAQEDLYNTPMAQEDLYNVPTGAEESEYNVPAALLAASNPSPQRRPLPRY